MNLQRLAVLVLCISAECSLTLAQALNSAAAVYRLTNGRPVDVGLDFEKLQKAVSIVRHAVEDSELPGAVLLVARRGKVVLHEAIGFRDANRKQPMQKDSLFRMASNSKAITAAGIMLLVENGKLKLDDPVGTYLPAFKNDAWDGITLRHLLTHTSGLSIKPLFFTPLIEKSSQQPDAPSLLLEVDRFAAVTPTSPPGKTYQYNNAGYNTLAGVIEKVTGSYKEHLRTRLYEPLGMKDSCNHESDADHDRMSTVMRRRENGSWTTGWTPGDKPDWPFPRGSGGMVTTAWDYAVFCQMLLNKGKYGGKQIFSEETVKEMTQPQSKHIAAASTYGLGWVASRFGSTFSHSGSDGTYVWVDPRNEIIGMVLTQTNGTKPPRDAFRALVNQAITDRRILKDFTISTTQRAPDGFYKDVFISGGSKLNGHTILFAAESLGLEYEFYAGSDVGQQNRFLVGSKIDENGVLLYPDGEPRFRMLYVGGGTAAAHGRSLTKLDRNRLRQFFNNGGSYCGSSAGSFLSSRSVDDSTEKREGYLHIFPYNTWNTGIQQAQVAHRIPDDSPLLRFRDFGDDSVVTGILHNNGNWLKVDNDLPFVEVLATYDYPHHKVNGGAAIWAYRPDQEKGRIVNIGSHPEKGFRNEQQALTEACFLYALEGTGAPRLKAKLEFGRSREMHHSSSEGKPEFARIGDRQYHHFAFDVADEKPVTIEINSTVKADLHLLLSDKSLALRRQATVMNLRSGANKKIERRLTKGRWFVSVYCASTVEAIKDSSSGFHRYIGDRGVLNGVPYTITLE